MRRPSRNGRRTTKLNFLSNFKLVITGGGRVGKGALEVIAKTISKSIFLKIFLPKNSTFLFILNWM